MSRSIWGYSWHKASAKINVLPQPTQTLPQKARSTQDLCFVRWHGENSAHSKHSGSAAEMEREQERWKEASKKVPLEERGHFPRRLLVIKGCFKKSLLLPRLYEDQEEIIKKSQKSGQRSPAIQITWVVPGLHRPAASTSPRTLVRASRRRALKEPPELENTGSPAKQRGRLRQLSGECVAWVEGQEIEMTGWGMLALNEKLAKMEKVNRKVSQRWLWSDS